MRIPAIALSAITAILLLSALTACTSSDTQPPEIGATARAVMTGPQGEAMGSVTLTQGMGGVLVSADLAGLTPGPHGFHIHETGKCAPDFSAAGDHFAPEGLAHGYMNTEGSHAGDLPNIYANADGSARADFFNVAITIQTGETNSVLDADGSAIIVHEKADTYGADAGAGGRVACGVITPS